MILLADSGSTTADWCLIKPSGKHWEWTTPGINPHLQNVPDIKRILNLLVSFDSNGIETIYYYGAGCSNQFNCSRIFQALQQTFNNAEIHVSSDLLGACRASLGDQHGHVAILGTGSNSCYYNGTQIEQQIPNLGYVLGDEGGGVHMGKLLIRAYFYLEMPEAIRTSFERNFGPTNDIISQIYQRPKPNAYLASFSTFLSANREEEFCQQIIRDSISAFIKDQLLKYDKIREYRLHIIGSIGQHFETEIRDLLENYNIPVGSFIQKPIQALAEYHQKQSTK